MHSPELKILALVATANGDPGEDPQLGNLISQGVDVDLLVEMARKEGLAGLLYRGLQQSDLLKSLENGHRARLQSLYYGTAATNLKLTHEFKRVLQLANREKIPIVLLQGIALLRQVYPDPGLRPITDIDLWILPRDLSRLAPMLVSLGYEQDPFYPTTFKKEAVIFDLHPHLLWADRVRALGLLLPGSQEDLYHSTRLVDFEGEPVFSLGPSDQVIHLILHALKHGVSRLIWLVDIARLLARWNSTEWEELFNRARELGQEQAVSQALFLLAELLDFQPLPQTGRIPNACRIDPLVKSILRGRVLGAPLPRWAYPVLLSSGKSWPIRLAVILESLFPRPGILRQVFPDSPTCGAWGLYARRVAQLVAMMMGRQGARNREHTSRIGQWRASSMKSGA